jgi:molybdenum cofactor cytidylyltransferase
MIAAIILAAGQSKRMGQPKMLLPWGGVTVIEQVVATFRNAGVEEIVVITGGAREQVESLVGRFPIRTVHNPGYQTGEMLSSLQYGLSAMSPEVEAALIGLGDQPQVQETTVQRLRHGFLERGSLLLVPSFQRRRGHPWLVARPLWGELLAMKAPESPRDFLNRHAGKIDYVDVNTPTILADLDTPEDYRKSRPV